MASPPPPPLSLQQREPPPTNNNSLIHSVPEPGCDAGGDEVTVDYFRSKEILARLSETAERGLLGSLKGLAGTWERIVRAYESNCEPRPAWM